VQVLMTRGARKFVAPRHLPGPVPAARLRTDLWDAAAELAMGHIELARWADAIRGRLPPPPISCRTSAQGRADDLLTTSRSPVRARCWWRPR